MPPVAPVSGARNLTAAQLVSTYIVPLLGLTGVAQTTVADLAAYFSAGGAGAPALTDLTTVGAGTITAAGIVGGTVARAGANPTSFTDTSATADQIIAAMPDPDIGDGFIFRYVNNTASVATLAGGTGVTLADTVAANCTATYFVKYTAASTIVFTLIEKTPPRTVSGTFTANGATPVVVANVNVTANSVIAIGLKTVGGTVSPTAPNVQTVTAGTGFTIAGVASDTSTYNYTIIN